jgi:hypothetical protein
MARRVLIIAAALFALSFAPSAIAAPKHKIALRLEYERPEPPELCPDAEQLGLMIAAEFGYVVVRTDASAVLTVSVRRAGGEYKADLRAPHPSGNGAEWRRTLEKQGTCQELAYDIAALVRLGLGPLKWPGEEAPAVLAAPPEVDVERPEIRPLALRMPESLALLLPGASAALVGSTPAPAPAEEPPMQMEAALGVVVSPYGLPSVAVGGSGLLGLRWKRFALAMDIRAVITPASGIGEPPTPGRTSLVTVAFLPCGSVSFLDLCGVVAGSRLAFDLEAPSYVKTADAFSAGFGVHLAARWRFSKRFSLAGYVESTAELRSVVFRTFTTNAGDEPTPIWRSPFIRAVLGVSVSAYVFD